MNETYVQEICEYFYISFNLLLHLYGIYSRQRMRRLAHMYVTFLFRLRKFRIQNLADPLVARYEARALSSRASDYRFESDLGHARLSLVPLY
jgi:hypothetical protein